MLTKRTSKILALLLSVCLVMSMAPLTVFAEGAEQPTVSSVEVVPDTAETNDGAETETPQSEPSDESGGETTDTSDTETPESETPETVSETQDNNGESDSDSQTGEQTEASITISAFDKLPEETEWQNYDYGEAESLDDLTLPETLTATDVDDNAITVDGVTWESDPAFDPETARAYWFSPVLPEGYSLADGVTAPMITVIIKPEGGVQIQATSATGTMTIAGQSYDLFGNNVSDDTWSWNPYTATLTLDNYNGGEIVINCQSEDTIALNLRGNATVVSDDSTAIYCRGDLNITGNGALTATSSHSNGIYAYLLTISGSVNITAVSTDNDSFGSSGLVSDWGVSITDGANVTAKGKYGGVRSVYRSVTVENATLIVGDGADDGNIICDTFTITGSGSDVTVNGSVKGDNTFETKGNLTVSGGTVTVKGGVAGTTNHMGGKLNETDKRTVPGAPANLQITPDDRQLIISWTAPADGGDSAITGYKVSTDNGVNWTATGSTATTYTATGLENGTAYTVKVLAVNDSGDGAESEGVEGTPQNNSGDTDKPTVDTVSPRGTNAPTSGSVVITFSEAMKTDTAGTVSLNGGSALTGGSWSADKKVFTIPYSGLANDTRYTVNISGFADAAGNVMNAVTSGYTFTTVAATTTNITGDFTDPNFLAVMRAELGKGDNEPIYDTDNFAVVAGLDVSGEDIKSLAGLEHFTALTTLNCYSNQLATLPNLPGGLTTLNCYGNQLTVLPALPSGLTQLNCSGNQLTALDVTGLNSLLTLDCSYNIMADTSAVKGFNGTWGGNFIFDPQSTPGAPTGLQVTPGDGQLALSWIYPANDGGSTVTGYKVSTDDGDNWTATGGMATTYTVTGLTNGTAYKVKVRAVNANGDGAASESVTGTPSASGTIVTTAAELVAALGSAIPSTITLGGDITLDAASTTEMRAAHTLVIPSGYTLAINPDGRLMTRGHALTINGGGAVTIMGNSALSEGGSTAGARTLNLENITVNQQYPGGIQIQTLNVNGGATVNINDISGEETLGGMIGVNAGGAINVTSGGKINIENFSNRGINNSGTVHISGGEINVGAGQGVNHGIANAAGGTLKISNGGKLTGESGGTVYLFGNSTVEGANDIFNDRGTAFTATGQVTVGDNTAAPSANGLTMGRYVFDGTDTFEKSAITVTAYPRDTTVTQGAITESLSVRAAASNGAAVRYQWWRAEWNDTGDYWENNTKIDGATNSSLKIPTGLTAGKYGFYVVLSADGCDDVSTSGLGQAVTTVTTVTVNPPGGGGGDSGSGGGSSGGGTNPPPSSGGGSSSGGGGGSSGNSGGSSSTSSTTSNTPTPVSTANATNAANTAAAAAQASGASTATARLTNPGEISLPALQAMAAAAGMPLNLQADSIVGNAVDVRITLDPALAQTGLDLSASTINNNARQTDAHFERFFSNKLAAISLGQDGGFGQRVEIAARLDLAGWDTKRLYFYAYDRATNSYRRIEQPEYWIDTNGYLHFKTELAGEIIVSEGELEKL